MLATAVYNTDTNKHNKDLLLTVHKVEENVQVVQHTLWREYGIFLGSLIEELREGDL